LTGQTSSKLTRSLDVSLAGYTPVSVQDVEFTPATSAYCHPTGPSERVEDAYGNDVTIYDTVGDLNSEESASSISLSSNTITYTSQGAKHNTAHYATWHYGHNNPGNTFGYSISDDTYNYGKRVVSVTYRKNS